MSVGSFRIFGIPYFLISDTACNSSLLFYVARPVRSRKMIATGCNHFGDSWMKKYLMVPTGEFGAEV